MRIRFVVPLALVIAVVGADGVSAQPLPPPRVLTPGNRPAQPMLPPAGSVVVPLMPPTGRPLPPLPPPPGYRPSAYRVWQNYGLTYNGWLRPRVIQVNGGGYYLYNGYPYPVSVNPGRQFMPLAKE